MLIEIEALRQISIFATLSEQELKHIAAVTLERQYERGAIILLEGDMGGALHYVRAGLVKVFKTSTAGKEQALTLVSAGHTFNDVPALDGGPNPASATALEPSAVYVILRYELQRLVQTRPEVAEAVVQNLARALRRLVTLVEDLSLRHVTARLAKILLDQEDAARASQRAFHLTQQEMAALAGTAREVVGRSLKELETAGAIEMRQGRVIILNHERLLQFVAEDTR